MAEIIEAGRENRERMRQARERSKPPPPIVPNDITRHMHEIWCASLAQVRWDERFK